MIGTDGQPTVLPGETTSTKFLRTVRRNALGIPIPMNVTPLQVAICTLLLALSAHIPNSNSQVAPSNNSSPNSDAVCTADSEVTTMVSSYTIAQTIERLKASIEANGLDVLAIVKHGGGGGPGRSEAQHHETLFIGLPRVRALLSTTPLLTLDLPTKVLVWEDGEFVKVSFKEAECLRQRYDLTPESVRYFAQVEESVERALLP